MNQRSFSLTDAAIKAKTRQNFWTSAHVPLSSREEKDEDSTEINDLEKTAQTMEPQPASTEEALNEDIKLTLPRKAIPINKTGVNTPSGPVLRPKRKPQPLEQPSELATDVQPFLNSSTIGTLPPSGRPLEKKIPPFAERYERMTTYLEKPLYNRVHALHRQGEFPKIASLLNAAVREYLDRHYPSA